MSRLTITFAVAILTVWVLVCAAAVADHTLIALATIVTPVMLLPAGWMFTGDFLRTRKGLRDAAERAEQPQE